MLFFKIKRRCIPITISLCLAMISLTAAAKDFYIQTAGNDKTGDGSKNNPWKTLAYACSKVPEKSILHLGPGEFPENEQSLVPNGVSLIGSGPNKTFVIANCCNYLLKEYLPLPEKYLLNVIGSSNATFSGFTIDGNKRMCHGGLLIHNASNLKINNIRVRLFNFCGIWVTNSNKVNLYNLDIENCAWPNNQSCSGAIMIGDLENSNFHDSRIREDRAYGFKVWSYLWTNHEPYLSRDFQKCKLTNVDIYDLDIRVEPKGAWAKGMSPNFTMEFWSSDLANCKLHDCYLNETVSIPEPGINILHTMEVYNNRFIMPDNKTIPSYALEALCTNLVIHDNYFKGGYYPIAGFGGTAKGQQIYNNVFHDIWGIAVINDNAMVDCDIFNNTVYGLNDMPFLKFGGKDPSANNRIHHNLFYAYNQQVKQALIKYPDNKQSDTTAFKVYKNWFYNWAVYGHNYFSGDPLLLKSGKVPYASFSIQRKSPLAKLKIGSLGLHLKAIKDSTDK